MKVKLNGEVTGVMDGMTVLGLLNELKLNPKVTVVEKNGEIINMQGYESEKIVENDVIELIRYVGGG